MQILASNLPNTNFFTINTFLLFSNTALRTIIIKLRNINLMNTPATNIIPTHQQFTYPITFAMKALLQLIHLSSNVLPSKNTLPAGQFLYKAKPAPSVPTNKECIFIPPFPAYRTVLKLAQTAIIALDFLIKARLTHLMLAQLLDYLGKAIQALLTCKNIALPAQNTLIRTAHALYMLANKHHIV